jgi:Uncharacterized protein conserved in bacteria
MITKIRRIKELAVFKDFDWNATVRDKGNNVATFKKLNIIYGRNYSGKTSLSRIFRAFKKGEINNKYKGAVFELEHSGKEAMNQATLQNPPYVIRVYNKDFVEDNLKWLVDEGGAIKPFAIIGEKNVLLEKQIEEKEKSLGREDAKVGLKYDLSQLRKALQTAEKEVGDARQGLDEKLKNKANNEIKRNTTYNVVTYNINSIKTDISALEAKQGELLSPEAIEAKRKLLGEHVKDEISIAPPLKLNLPALYQRTKVLLEKPIKPTKSIQDLLDDAVLQEWVRKGMGYHRDSRTTCAFCGCALPSELWDKLDGHFSKESEELRQQIESLIPLLQQEKGKVANFLVIEKDSFYSTFQDRCLGIQKAWLGLVNDYQSKVDSLLILLDKRKECIFSPIEIHPLTDPSGEMEKIDATFRALITENNKKAKTLIEDQKAARNELRLDDIAKFLLTIGYKKEQVRIAALAQKEAEVSGNVRTLATTVTTLEKEISQLKLQLKDERKGAEKVNEYLGHHFGHDGLKLVAVEGAEGAGINFQIKRGETVAHNLSEGECSLVAFCYFMAKLEDIDTKGKDLIIWIDDPISSLDSNHVFFIFSLIESALAKPFSKQDGSNGYRYNQLFISTHNLDFLKYLKRLSSPKNDSAYFVIERGRLGSQVKVMPTYLQKYITEFNYLFHQIYKCANETDTSHDCFYNFGNNLRKFLEAYLFYKYPSSRDINVKLKLFFREDQLAVDLANRLDNEYSHLEEIFDRSVKPIEIPEIPTLAKYVLTKIKERDNEQYDALLESIGEQAGA